jgi:D-aminoacyl-tRNA deacylase
MILVAASNRDPASLNIRRQVLGHYDFKETTQKFQGTSTYVTELGSSKVRLVTLNQELVFAQDLTDFFKDPELVVFISRHSSESGKPTLSVHTPGNLGEATMGGIARQVSVSPANAMRETLKTLVKFREELRLNYEVSYEGTHHGPSLNAPTMFAELGSTPKQWKDSKAAEAVAHAAMKAAETFGDFSAKTVLGLGGPHYSEKFTRMALENRLAFGHIIPKYAVMQADSQILKQCLDRTLERVESIVLDWKGIRSDDKPALSEILREINVQSQKA